MHYKLSKAQVWLVLLMFSLLSGSIHAVAPTHSLKKSTENHTIADFLNSSNKDIEKISGKKMTLTEKIGLGFIRKKMRKALRDNPELANTSLSTYLAQACAKIVLKNGDVIEADILQITPTEVKYKRCGKANDPETILYKKDVLSIMASDGEVIFRNTGSNTYSPSGVSGSDGVKSDPLAITSLATGVGGLIIGLLLSGIIGIVAGIVGIVLGFISLSRIKKNPEKYSGKGMAWAGIICGIVIVSLFAILLAVLV